jgi:3-oxoacyl-[acyl-carrier protein] reductase
MRHGVLEYSPHVRINTIAPGNVDTDWASELTEEEREAAARESPLKRWIKPVEVANTVVFLLSEESSAVNNQIIALDGGYVTGR